MKEKGDALLETVLIAPIILMIGLLATEFGAAALSRAQLSEAVRSTINKELLDLESSVLAVEEHALEMSIEKSLRALPSLDTSKLIEVQVTQLKESGDLVRELPFLASDGREIKQNPPKEFEVRVKVHSKGLINSRLKLPVLVDVVHYRSRG